MFYLSCPMLFWNLFNRRLRPSVSQLPHGSCKRWRRIVLLQQGRELSGNSAGIRSRPRPSNDAEVSISIDGLSTSPGGVIRVRQELFQDRLGSVAYRRSSGPLV